MESPPKPPEERSPLELERDRFFALSHDLLCVASYDGYFKIVNPAFEQALGYTKNELCTKPYLFFIHPDDIERTKQEVQAQLAAGKIVVNFENRYRHKDGSYVTLSWSSTPTKTYMYGSARDITELKKSQEALKKATSAAETANRELEAFCYSVAHDLRSPLRALDGFSQALLDGYSDKIDVTGKDYLHRVRAGAQRMGQLIDDLLRLSQVSRTELQHGKVDLTKLFLSIAERYRKENPKRSVNFAVPDGLTVDGDAKLLEVAMDNLVGNAWKYTGKRETASVEVGQKPGPDGTPVYYIRDNGAGFDMAYSSKLFGAFQRLHLAKDFPGSGIGLATVQRILHRHGGRIWAEAAVEKGATFFFTLGH